MRAHIERNHVGKPVENNRLLVLVPSFLVESVPFIDKKINKTLANSTVRKANTILIKFIHKILSLLNDVTILILKLKSQTLMSILVLLLFLVMRQLPTKKQLIQFLQEDGIKVRLWLLVPVFVIHQKQKKN